MSHARKHKPHHCKNHPGVAARGKCSRCGAWVCRGCAVLQSGQFFCADSCAPQPAAQKAASTPPMPQGSRAIFTASHTAIAATTFALCVLALLLWQVRANMRLRNEVRDLREQRMGLIDNLRQANSEISCLRDSLSNRAEIGPVTPRRFLQSQIRDTDRTPSSALPLPVSFDNGPRDQMLIALTFDGGSHDNAVDDILDTLALRKVRATMFVTGEFIRRFPDAILRIAGAGHEFGNHTATHPHLTTWQRDQTHTTLPGVDATVVARELREANDAFRKVTGRDMLPIWRAPYGEKNRQICLWAQAAGYLHIGWRQGRTWRENLDSNDWIPNKESPGYREPQEVLDKILSLAAGAAGGLNGGIILLHLGAVRKDPRSQVHRILGVLIDRLSAMGYRFVTISEMLAAAGVAIGALDSVRTLNEGRIAAR